MRLAALLALVLVFAAPSCASAANRASGTGILRGTVTRGPLTPVCSTAQPCYAPAVGVKLVFFRHGRAVGHTKTRAGGHYRIRLAAGRYAIRVRSGLSWKPRHVRVRSGRVTRLHIAIDTGIR